MPRAAGDSTHYSFTLNGDAKLGMIQLPSVTTILHRIFGAPQHVVNWAANNFADADEMKAYRQVRSDEGTAAHDFVERFVKAADEEAVKVKTRFDEAFLKFVVEKTPTFTLSEQVVYSLKMRYAGTLDLGILEAEGKTRIVDVKTRKKTTYRAYDTDLLQCTAYGLAAQEMGILPQGAFEIGVLMLKNNGLYTYIDDQPAMTEAWKATLALYNELEGDKGA